MPEAGGGDRFYFTASYNALPVLKTREEWFQWKRVELGKQRRKAKQAGKPMAPMPDADMDVLLSLGVRGFHCHSWIIDPDTVEQLLDRGFVFFSYPFDYPYLGATRPGPDVDVLGCIEGIRRRFLNRKGPFFLCAALEQDCTFTGPRCPFRGPVRSKADAYRQWREHFLTRDGCFPYFLEYCRRHGVDMTDLNVMVGQHQQWHHYNAEWGASALFSEGNCDLVCDQVRIAMLRGAARQYRKEWFLYWSSWGGTDHHVTWFNRDGRLDSGVSPSLNLRQWVGSFYSGCRYCAAIENPPAQLFYVDRRGKRRLSPFGRAARKFTRYVAQRHPERGEPYVPFALMLEHDHGWSPREHRVWGGALPYGREEEMIENFFRVAFPHFDEGTPYKKLPWRRDDALPWHSQEDLVNKVSRGEIDSRMYEKPFRTESTWGDGFDVVLDNCTLSVLKTYKVVVLLGGIRLDAKLRARLRAYVRQGGTVICNSVHVSRSDQNFLGVRFSGRRDILWETRCETCGGIFRQWDGEIDLVRPAGAGVLQKAVGGFRNGHPEVKRVPGYDGVDPVATEHRIGKGRVIFTTLPYLQTAAGRDMHPAACDLFDHVFKTALPVRIEGRPIEFMLNRTTRGWIVTLMHNGPDYWKGEKPRRWQGKVVLELAAAGKEGRWRVRELWSDTDLRYESRKRRLVVNVTVPAFGFKVISLERYESGASAPASR